MTPLAVHLGAVRPPRVDCNEYGTAISQLNWAAGAQRRNEESCLAEADLFGPLRQRVFRGKRISVRCCLSNARGKPRTSRGTTRATHAA